MAQKHWTFAEISKLPGNSARRREAIRIYLEARPRSFCRRIAEKHGMHISMVSKVLHGHSNATEIFDALIAADSEAGQEKEGNSAAA